MKYGPLFGICDFCKTPEELIEDIRKFKSEGAHGVVLDLEKLDRQYWTTEWFRKIFSAVKFIEIYACFYRDAQTQDLTDDDRAKYLTMAAEAGADIVDIMGDMFDPQPDELSVDPEAIFKQKKLIAEIKKSGSVVLMSSHVRKPKTTEETLKYFYAHSERGADISKAVFVCNTEAELQESRISIMLSQIQPHFIYNTLGTIERMCLKDPEKAFHLVRNFSLYLRGNFSELDSVTPIRFAEELKHVEYYVNIEKVRFPDMNIEYDVETTDFVLPALSVQPLVENAIKHGLMRLETGGTVVIRSYETPTQFCVEVKDDGVGFDTSLPVEEKKHVGLRNIRGRLKAMVNGELILESKLNVGTKAVIMIPKEVTV